MHPIYFKFASFELPSFTRFTRCRYEAFETHIEMVKMPHYGGYYALGYGGINPP
jgi:hypothetical protein